MPNNLESQIKQILIKWDCDGVQPALYEIMQLLGEQATDTNAANSVSEKSLHSNQDNCVKSDDNYTVRKLDWKDELANHIYSEDYEWTVQHPYITLFEANGYPFSELVEFITNLTQQVREEEQRKALDIAKACVITRKVGSPYPLVVIEKMYEGLLKVGLPGVEALRKLE